MQHAQNLIHLLDDQLINKIAAGEVIENVSSIVKELIENAIDAKASTIEVITKMKGEKVIVINDDGVGMGKEDLSLSIKRHATSKIENIEDLFYLPTFGFRGEALAAIAAMSKMTISSSRDGIAHTLHVEGGEKLRLESSSLQKGTRIEVRDLFYNLPVRKNFQKSDSHERASIEKVMINTFLAFPHLSLKWTHEDCEEINISKDRKAGEGFEVFFGKEWQNEFFLIKEEGISGYLGTPYSAKSTKNAQYLFVNRRPIVSKLISDAVKEGYGTRIGEGKYPCFILFCDLPSHTIDINVHPQKKEIRFQDEKKLHQMIVNSIKKCLEKKYEPIVIPQTLPSSSPIAFTLAPMPLDTSPAKEEVVKNSFLLLAVIDSYLLIHKEGYFLVHAPRAKRRVFFERLEKKHLLPMQQLLLPITFELKGERKKACEENLSFFESLRISIRSIGEGFFMIDALPETINEEDFFHLLDKIEDEKKEEKKIPFSLNHLIRGGKPLTFFEGEKLLETLFLCQTYHLCPEGKPILLSWPKEEIKKLFL